MKTNLQALFGLLVCTGCGSSTTFAPSAAGVPFALTAGATGLFWWPSVATRGESWDRSGMLLTAPTAGGPTVQVASGTFIRRIAIDASTLYWITRDVADVP